MKPEKRKHLLHITSTLEDLGYVSLIWHFARLVDPEQYRVYVCCMRKGGPYIEKFQELGVEVLNLDMKFYLDLRVIPRMVRFIRKNDIDIVHTHIRLADWYGRVCSKLAGVPSIFSTIHNADYWRKERKYLVLALIDRLTMRLNTHVIAVSQAVKDFVVKAQKIDADRISVVLNGTVSEKYTDDSGSAAVKQSLGLNENKIYVGTAARLVKQKAQHDLLYAAQKILKQRSDMRLVVVGDGPLEHKLKNLARELGIEDSVVFTGFRTDIPQILAGLDIFVMCSLYEGLGVAVVEAMLAGKPVVATDVIGINEVVVDRETGILVPPSQPQALAAAIQSLMDSEDLREQMGARGRARALANFNIERMKQDLVELYTAYTRNADC
jgi:glycosyltransferase involved in cell wall biosynthesis